MLNVSEVKSPSSPMQVMKSGTIVLMSNDYSIFKIHKANRDVDPVNIKTIEEGMKKKFLLSSFPIVVNKNYEIMDGQTRFYAARNLKQPIYYIVDENIKIEDVAQLNFTRRWKKVDLIKMGAELGDPTSIELRKRIAYGATLGYGVMSILVFSRVRQDIKGKTSGINSYEEFLSIISMSEDIFRTLNIKRCGKLSKSLFEILRHPHYIHERMLRMLKKHGGDFVVLASEKENQLKLEEYYNREAKSSDDYVKLTLKARVK